MKVNVSHKSHYEDLGVVVKTNTETIKSEATEMDLFGQLMSGRLS